MIKVETAVIAKVAMSNNVSAAGTKGQKQLYPKRRVKTCSDSFSKLLKISKWFLRQQDDTAMRTGKKKRRIGGRPVNLVDAHPFSALEFPTSARGEHHTTQCRSLTRSCPHRQPRGPFLQFRSRSSPRSLETKGAELPYVRQQRAHLLIQRLQRDLKWDKNATRLVPRYGGKETSTYLVILAFQTQLEHLQPSARLSQRAQ